MNIHFVTDLQADASSALLLPFVEQKLGSNCTYPQQIQLAQKAGAIDEQGKQTATQCVFYDTDYALLCAVPFAASYSKMMKACEQFVSVVNTKKCTQIQIDARLLECSDEYTNFVVALLHASYSFIDYKSEPQHPIATVTICAPQFVDANSRVQSHQYITALSAALTTCKDAANTPANNMTPTEFARRAQTIADANDAIDVKVVDESVFAAMGMNAFLFVAKGSEQSAKMVLLRYQGADEQQTPYALVGKGVTFDTGGISLKPPAKMDEMKYDMCGAATALATLQAVAQLQLPINLVVACALAENMPSGKAGKPGDIVTSLSGKTIEILNTDAEGRLVLCDTMTYVQNTYKPKVMIDIATLTGACIIALGHKFAAMFSNNDQLANDLKQASASSEDLIWQLPMDEAFHEQLKSPFADIANIGNVPAAQSAVAACFLAQFCQEDCAWAHLDIAGVAWHGGAKKAATGRPVRLLVDYFLAQSKVD